MIVIIREILQYSESMDDVTVDEALARGVEAYNSQEIVLGPEDFHGDAEIRVIDPKSNVDTGWLSIE